MKKLLILACAMMFLVASGGLATEPDLFSFDRSAVEAAMTDLDRLEEYVLQNVGITLSQMVVEGLFENKNLVNPYPPNSNTLFGEPPLGIPSFLWGCIPGFLNPLLGVGGLAIVYFISEDSDETTKALYGCIIGSLLSLVGYYYYFYY